MIILYIIDTYEWVEYFIGSDRGKQVKKIVEDVDNTIITPECCLAEIKGWCIREKQDFDEMYSLVRKISEIECVLTQDWLDAASIRSEMRKTAKDFGMMDALIMAQQRRMGCRVVSGDQRFNQVSTSHTKP